MRIRDYYRKHHTIGDDEAEFIASDIDDSTSVQYFGFLTHAGAWAILKLDESTSPKTIRYVFGKSGYDFSTRAGLDYQIYSDAL